MESLDPEMLDFLLDAAELARRYDNSGRDVLPVKAWPMLLSDLRVQEDSEAAYFLMDYLDAAGEGFFTYAPMVNALRRAGRLGQGESRGGDFPKSFEDDLAPSSTASSHFQGFEEDGRLQPLQSSPSAPPASSPTSSTMASTQRLNFPELENFDQVSARSASTRSASAYGSEVGSRQGADDIFWQLRGASIKDLFYKWDCNQLSNESFAAKLQDLLGDVVDISASDSEFMRICNKHRSARNMKFAALMSALRHDAQQTQLKRYGKVSTLPALSEAGSSYAPSNYEPSEAGSHASRDVRAFAAGRPTGAVKLVVNASSGRKHYQQSDSASIISSNPAESAARSQYTRAPPPYASGYPDAVPCSRPQGGYSSAPPWASSNGHDDTMSVRSDASKGSNRSAMIQNHVGHGNILTWGGDSRPLTPEKKRSGRELKPDHVANRSTNPLAHR